jgi:hypothetical protein
MATEYKHLTNSLQGCKFGFAIFVYRGKQWPFKTIVKADVCENLFNDVTQATMKAVWFNTKWRIRVNVT